MSPCGIARTSDVSDYLRGVAHTDVTNLDYAGPWGDDFQADYSDRTGSGHPAPPARSDIWVASQQGTGRQTLDWDVKDGDWSVVVMNADGSPGVDADISAGAKVPYLSTLGFVALGLGVAFIVGTALLTLYGTRPPARMLVAA